MNDKVNQLLTSLSRQPLDHSLVGLEHDVECAFRNQLNKTFYIPIFEPLQIAALSMALVVGVMIGNISGGTSNAAPVKSTFFAAEEKLAISTILEGG